jgi:hypothetical protein
MASQVNSFMYNFSLSDPIFTDTTDELAPPQSYTTSTALSRPTVYTPLQRTIQQTIESTFSFRPYSYQIAALQSLLGEKRDTILYAGKSLIAQSYPLLCSGWVLCIIPLTRLGDEQVKKLNSVSGLRAFLLHDKTNTHQLCSMRSSPIA